MRGVCLTLAVLAGAACAASDVRAENWPARSLSVEVSGYITPRCHLDQDQRQVDFGDLLNRATGASAGGSAAIAFQLDCNAPVQVSLASQRGGLRWQGSVPTTDPDFLLSVPYRAETRMTPLGGSGVLTCDSADMKEVGPSASCTATTGGASRGAGEIKLTVEAGGGLLLNGQYTDTLVLNVTPILGGERTGGGK